MPADVGKGQSDSEETLLLDDGRKVRVFADTDSLADSVPKAVAQAAKEAIAEKGAFSLAVCGGEVSTALKGLFAQPGLDFARFHVFFCYDALEPASPPCHEEAQRSWLGACGVPPEQVHAMPSGLPPEAAAAQYTATICMQEEDVVGDSEQGLPSVDLALLCTGDDGRCGGVRPASPEAAAAGSGQVVLFRDGAAAEGPGPTLAVSLDFLSSARQALVLAGAESRAAMVQAALGIANEGSSCPGALLCAPETTWLVTGASAAQLRSALPA